MFLIKNGDTEMKSIIYIALGLVLTNIANAASVNYRFVGMLPEIDFTLEVDFEREGFIINNDGSIFNFDPSRNAFFVNYQSGNFSLAPSTNQFQRFYGEDSLTPEGIFGCVYALNSIGVCDTLDTATFDGGGVRSWQVGRRLELLTFDSMGTVFDHGGVRLESITAVPLPTTVWLFGSGLIGLIGVARRKKS